MYRIDLLEKKGVKVPTTLEELEAASAKLGAERSTAVGPFRSHPRIGEIEPSASGSPAFLPSGEGAYI
jgi:hypothetical protein